jgi:hypothetical protein
MVIICLGYEVELTVVPQSIQASLKATDTSLLDGLMSMDIDDAKDHLNATVNEPKSASTKAVTKKKTKDCQFTLVHGDALILTGDEFEVSTLDASSWL